MNLSRRHILLIVLLWAIIYLPTLFRPALLDDADSVHAEAAREILTRGDWVTLHANGIRYLEKAPLMYWSTAVSYAAFGVSEWSTRLPLALYTLAALLALYALGRRAYGERAGFYAAVVLATSFGIFIYTRILIPEIMVCLWLTLGFYFFLQTLDEADAGRSPSRLACWGLAATMALDVLTKSLIGIVFPAAVIVAFLLLTGNLRHLLRMRLASSFAVFLAIAAPWHVMAHIRTPDQPNGVRGWAWFYFINEQVYRYLNKREPRDYGTVPFAVFWGALLIWLMPWSAFLFKALGQVPARLSALRGGLTREQRASLLFALWALVVLGFFTFSTRQEYYVIPALPALALLVGGWLAKEEAAEPASPLRRAGRRVALVLFVIGAIAGVTALALGLIARTPPPGVDLADLMRKNPDMYALSFGHFFDLTADSLGAFRLPLLFTGITFLAGTFLNWRLRRSGDPARANVALTAMAVVFLYCALGGLIIYEPILSSKQLARAIQERLKPGDIIMINGEYEEGSTLNFYTGHQVHILNGRRANLWYGSFFPDAPQIFHDDASFAKVWTGDRRVYLWTDEERYPALLRVPGVPAHELARRGGKMIVSNRP